MTWAQRLKRVFNIDIVTCRECGGAMEVIACIRPGRDQEDTHLPGGQSPDSQTRAVAREPGAATGAFVRLTPGKPIVQLNRLRR